LNKITLNNSLPNSEKLGNSLCLNLDQTLFHLTHFPPPSPFFFPTEEYPSQALAIGNKWPPETELEKGRLMHGPNKPSEFPGQNGFSKQKKKNQLIFFLSPLTVWHHLEARRFRLAKS
jgi:hypothetical protein